MAKLDSLIVDLQLNTAELKKGLDEANNKLGDFGKKIDSLAGVITFDRIGRMALEAGKALATFVLRGAESVDKMGKMAEAAGVSVESFSQINYAGSLAGVSTDELAGAMLKLNKNISEAAAGGVEQAAMFRALGVSITDSNGKVKTADVVLGDLAESFSGLEGGASKASLAADIFGKAVGGKMIPLLNDGKAGLKAAADEADRFGATISAQAVQGAEAFNDNLTRMRTAMDVVAQGVAAQLAPAMSKFADELINTKDGAFVLKGAIDTLAFVMKGLVSVGVIVGAVFEAVGKALAAYASMIVNLVSGNLEAARVGANEFFAAFTSATKSAGERIEAVWTDVAKTTDDATKKNEEAAKRSADAAVAAIERAKKAAAEYKTAWASLTKVAEDYESKVAGFGMGELGLIEARLNTGDLADQLKKVGENAEQMKQRILDAAQALNDLKIDFQMAEVKFEYGRAQATTAQNIDERRQDYALASSSDPNARRTMEMAGFKDFESALSSLAANTDRNAKLLGEAETLRFLNEHEAAREVTLAADEAGRAAKAAGKAADGFVDLAKETLQHQKQIMNIALGVLGTIGEKGSEVGALINTAMQGFQAGGIWGAIIAVIAALFAKLEAVGTFIDQAFGDFMEAFGQINESMSVLFSSLSESLAPVFRALRFIFKMLNDLLVPIFNVMQQVMEPFEAIAEGFMDLIEGMGIFEFVVKALTTVFNTIGLIIGAIILGLQYVWAGILRAVRAIVSVFTLGAGTKEIDETIAKHDAEIAKTKKRLAKTAANIDEADANSGEEGATSSTPADPNGVGTGTTEFEMTWARNERRATEAEARRYRAYSEAIAAGLGYEAAIAAGELAKNEFLALPLEEIVVPVEGLGDAAADAAAELNKFTASLTNVPTGFKYNLTKFNSTMGEGGEQFNRGGDTNIRVEGSILSEQRLVDLIESINRTRRFRTTGVSATANYR